MTETAEGCRRGFGSIVWEGVQLTIHFVSDDTDITPPMPLLFEFVVPGHDHSYHIGSLLPYYGTDFCNRFEGCWTRAVMFQRATTAENYFKAVRTALLWTARRGVSNEKSSEGKVLNAFRSGRVPSDKDWAETLSLLAGAIGDINDRSFIDSSNPESRNKKGESLRMGLWWLAGQGFSPEIDFEFHRLEDRHAKASKCIATVAYDAGRFSVIGMTASAAVETFLAFNKKVLEEIRHCLWLELKANNDAFELGLELMADERLPSFDRALTRLVMLSRDSVRNGDGIRELGLTERQGLGLALRILKAQACGNKVPERLMDYARSVIDHSSAQPYFEATTKALNAAYHIVLIDAGANCQSVDDIPFDCYSSKAKRGKVAVRSLRLVKNRKMGANVVGKIKEHLKETQLYIETKATSARPSGIVVIEIWKKLTQGMRKTSGPTATRLWLWRTAGKQRVETRLVSMSSDRFPEFLQRHSNNEMFGGLPLTRPMLRTTVHNAIAGNGDIDFVVQKALMNHSSSKVTYEYLTEGAVRAILNEKIRTFMNALEATHAITIDAGAAMLGVPDDDFYRSAQLGLGNGLEFAAIGHDPDGSKVAENEIGEDALLPSAKAFRVSDGALVRLELARRALRSQFEAMLNLNPLRLLRTWVPYLAIVEGYCQKLDQTRFRVRLRRSRDLVDSGLASGELRLPILW